MARLLALPIELIDRIMSFIPNQQTLASLSVTNKLLHKLTSAPLYHSVTIRPGKAPSFEAAIANNPGRLNYVKEIHVDYDNPSGDQPRLSACTHAPLYAALTNLEVLELNSGFWHWDDEDCEGREPVLWATDQNRLTSLFEQASLDALLNVGIWTKLKVLTIDLSEQNGQGWYCPFEPAIFLIQSLEELTLRGCRFWDGDGEQLLTSPHLGTTVLKKLALERSYIYHTSVYRFLTAPKALTHLRLEHCQSLWHHEMGDQPSTSERAQDYMNAFKLHQHSLQSLYMNEEMCSEIHEDSVKEGEFDFSEFPKLEVICFEGQEDY